jgi:hypothetical protein
MFVATSKRHLRAVINESQNHLISLCKISDTFKSCNDTFRNQSPLNDTQRPNKHSTPILESLDGKKLSLRQTLKIQERQSFRWRHVVPGHHKHRPYSPNWYFSTNSRGICGHQSVDCANEANRVRNVSETKAMWFLRDPTDLPRQIQNHVRRIQELGRNHWLYYRDVNLLDRRFDTL